MMSFYPVKVRPFLKPSVKVRIRENGVFTFPNSFLDLSQLLPVFPRERKASQALTFLLFPPIYRGKVKKLDSHKLCFCPRSSKSENFHKEVI